jgi:hypothetical protein
MAQHKKIEENELVVCLVSGSGLKDIANAAAAVGEPLTVDPTIESVSDALAR